jgi:hypothetical protein
MFEVINNYYVKMIPDRALLHVDQIHQAAPYQTIKRQTSQGTFIKLLYRAQCFETA